MTPFRRPARPRLGSVEDDVTGQARVVLLGRPGCHLCEAAREVVERVAGELGVSVGGALHRG